MPPPVPTYSIFFDIPANSEGILLARKEKKSVLSSSQPSLRPKSSSPQQRGENTKVHHPTFPPSSFLFHQVHLPLKRRRRRKSRANTCRRFFFTRRYVRSMEKGFLPPPPSDARGARRRWSEVDLQIAAPSPPPPPPPPPQGECLRTYAHGRRGGSTEWGWRRRP